MEGDPGWNGLVCMEEPENGIHPSRIPAILRLLRAISVDLDHAVDETNALRQVILNTHSPEVVGLAPQDSLLVAVPSWTSRGGNIVSCVEFRPLMGTWRDAPDLRYGTLTQIVEYLRAIPIAMENAPEDNLTCSVVGRPEIRSLFPEDMQ
jgi:hypothetical protein